MFHMVTGIRLAPASHQFIAVLPTYFRQPAHGSVETSQFPTHSRLRRSITPTHPYLAASQLGIWTAVSTRVPFTYIQRGYVIMVAYPE
jgi:hypothetical protein